jgi:hypothetical protein
VSSLVFFFIHKTIIFELALPLMACNVAGSYLGSRLAVMRGNAFIRKLFLAVIAGIIVRFAWDIFSVQTQELVSSPSQKRLIFRHFSPFFSYVAPAMRLQKRKN